MTEVDLVRVDANDLLDVAVAAVFIAAGLATLALSAFRRRGSSGQFVALGTFAVLYGVRLVEIALPAFGVPRETADYVEPLITYFLPLVPFVYARSVMGRGWAGSLSAIVVVQVVYATAATLLDLWHSPKYAMRPNNYLMLASFFVLTANVVRHVRAQGIDVKRELRRSRDWQLAVAGFVAMVLVVFNENMVEAGLVPWRFSHEPAGVLLFIACLGGALAHRLFTREVDLAGVEHELATARKIQQSLLPGAFPARDDVRVSVQYRPMAAVGGDFWDFHENRDGSIALLVADVSGHGVPAALVASMVKVAFGAQRDGATDPARVLSGIRDAIGGSGMSRQIVTAACVVIDTKTGELRYANAGHPALLLEAGGKVLEVAQSSPPIGAFRNHTYCAESLVLLERQRLVLYSDGVTECSNAKGEQFGDERLRMTLTELSDASADEAARELLVRLAEWRGDRREHFDDDVTIVTVDVGARRG